eukprot:2183147-Pyramimonas_sp.AAC.1
MVVTAPSGKAFHLRDDCKGLNLPRDAAEGWERGGPPRLESLSPPPCPACAFSSPMPCPACAFSFPTALPV